MLFLSLLFVVKLLFLNSWQIIRLAPTLPHLRTSRYTSPVVIQFCSGRNKDQKLIDHFCKLGHLAIKMEFGWRNAAIGQKMANVQLQFLVLVLMVFPSSMKLNSLLLPTYPLSIQKVL